MHAKLVQLTPLFITRACTLAWGGKHWQKPKKRVETELAACKKGGCGSTAASVN
jgi:hypothetical protein